MADINEDISHLIERIDLTEQITGVLLGDQIFATKVAIRGKKGKGRYKILLNGEIIAAPPETFSVDIKFAIYDLLERVSMVAAAQIRPHPSLHGIYSKFNIDSRVYGGEYNGKASKLKIWISRIEN